MVFKEICQGTIISLNFFFLKRFLIISELQTEKMNEFTPSAVVAMKVLWEAREKVLLFLQTLNKYVPYCFDASCDQNNVGSAVVLRDQDWNAMAKEESFEQVVIEGITVRTPSI